jgi:hypothetical protein
MIIFPLRGKARGPAGRPKATAAARVHRELGRMTRRIPFNLKQICTIRRPLPGVAAA